MTQNKSLGPPWTILKLLEWTTQFFESHALESPRMEAELLLSHTLGLKRIMLYAHFDRPLEGAELASYRELVKRRARREPMAYITGSRGFWTIELKTDRRALIPRPDTETLVEAALKRLPSDSTARVADVGTGTGAIALALAHERPLIQVFATDLSQDALDLAAQNAQALGLAQRVTLCCGDLLDALPPDAHALDLIVSNPPYIGEQEREALSVDVRDYEPALALFSGPDGLDTLRRLVPAALEALRPGGQLLCEIGYAQGAAVRALFERAGFEQVDVLQDLGRRDRVVAGVRPA